jgi:hypothetical protein
MEEKKCTKCGEIKSPEAFSREKRTGDKLRSMCKECYKTAYRKWRAQNPERARELASKWRKSHPDKVAKYNYKNKTEKQKKQSKVYVKNWHKTNPDKARGIALKWYYKNQPKAKATARQYQAKILSTERGKLNSNMRKRIGASLKNGSKARQHWESLVGYTVDQLRAHLEKKFTQEMTWENYGKVWEIDHKIPIAVFNFEKPTDIDFRICWSIKNLQPLKSFENRSKHSKIEGPFQPSLMMGI